MNKTVSAFNLQAFGNEKPNVTTKHLKRYFEIELRKYSHIYTGESKHPNFVNLNIIYNKKNASKAAKIRQREEDMRKERERKRIIMEQRDDFNKSIRKESGKLSI